MSDIIGAHTDVYELARGLKNSAVRNGHQNPSVSQNGTGFSLTCGGCGGQTHIEQHGPSGEWRATASHAHRLNTHGCA